MATQPTAIVFDLGKVLVDFDYSIAARRVAARSRMSLAELQRYLSESAILIRYETGLVDREAFFAEVCRETGFEGTLAEFGQFFADIFTEIPPMIELHAALRRQGLPTYIFSNTNDLAVTHIRNNFPFFSRFDGYIYSYEVRCMKPDAAIYEALERMSGRRGGELVYLDDRPENVEAGARRGWHAILHVTPEESRAGLAQLGLLSDSSGPGLSPAA